jgi:hypothetical protein
MVVAAVEAVTAATEAAPVLDEAAEVFVVVASAVTGGLVH